MKLNYTMETWVRMGVMLTDKLEKWDSKQEKYHRHLFFSSIVGRTVDLWVKEDSSNQESVIEGIHCEASSHQQKRGVFYDKPLL